jgi:antitoxin HigA-1
MTTRTFPPLPGHVLKDEILIHRHVRQADLARTMGVSAVAVSHIVNGHAPITASMALRLGHATGTSPDYWLKLQRKYDLFKAKQRLDEVLKKLPKVPDGTGEEVFSHSSEWSKSAKSHVGDQRASKRSSS